MAVIEDYFKMDVKYKVFYIVTNPQLGEKVATMRKWLEPNIGEEFIDWSYNWSEHTFYFKREDDKLKFILKWI